MAEDRRTRQALDELADLFLSDSSVNADRDQSDSTRDEVGQEGRPSPRGDGATGSPGTPASPDTTDASELTGPDPVRFHHESQGGIQSTGGHDPSFGDDTAGPGESETDGDSDETALYADQTPPLRLHRGDEEPELATHGPHDADAEDQPRDRAAGDHPSPLTDPVDAAVEAAIRRGQQQAQPRTSGAEASQTGGSPSPDDAGVGTMDRPAAARQRRPDYARPRGTETTTTAEAVLMGNLPGLNGPWLTQYGQALAQHVGPVVMLHVDDHRIDAELIEPTDQPRSAGRVPPGQPAQGDLIEQLTELTAPGPHQVQAVLVHTEASTRPAALERLNVLDRWTLLCGADDAAVIAAYRLVKSLVDADPQAARKQLGLMVLGSDRSASESAWAKLTSATRPVMRAPAEAVGCQRRMVPVNLRQLGRFGPTDQLWPRLAEWLQTLETRRPACDEPLVLDEAPGAPASDAAADEAGPQVADAPTDDGAADRFSEAGASADTEDAWAWLRDADRPGRFDDDPERRDPTAGAPRALSDAESPGEPAPSAGAGTEQSAAGARADDSAAGDGSEKAASASTADADADTPIDPPPATDETPDLATFLTGRDGALAGGMALEARCPEQPLTQLVLDQDGRLHLLRRHDSARDDHQQRDNVDGLRAAVVDLLAARRWVRQHLALLQLTQRQCVFDHHAEPVLHLFTDRADLATGLAGRLGETLRLHLLQHVRVGDQSTWLCTPLN